MVVDSLATHSSVRRRIAPFASPEIAMQYLLLIYSNEAQIAALDHASMSSLINDFRAFTESIIKGGQFKAGDRLRPTSSATTVRVRNGKTVTTDGPFAETREQLGGYFLIEAKDLDEAIAIAARIPSAKAGSIEVRPIWSPGAP
jgi:hypothetical protein